jgi:hypothetical protein
VDWRLAWSSPWRRGAILTGAAMFARAGAVAITDGLLRTVLPHNVEDGDENRIGLTCFPGTKTKRSIPAPV